MRVRRAIALLAAAGAATSVLMVPGNPAVAATASNLTTIDMGYNDSFWNYDFNSTAGGNTNVDWAISWLFYQNAEVDKIKGIMEPSYTQDGYAYAGSDKYARLSDGAGGVWDDDGGKKNALCVVNNRNTHMRLYADSDDQMYNPTFGWYVLGSNHYDINECGGGTARFGYSEDAEGVFESFFRGRGLNVWRNRYGWLNYEPTRLVGDHYWQNNGQTTTVIIP